MRRHDLLALGLIWLCVVGSVAAKFDNQFVYDDVTVVNGPLIHHPERLFEVFGSHAMLAVGSSEVQAFDTYRPVSVATFFWDAWLSGYQPWSYHLTNLLVHLGAISCLFALARLMFPAVGTVAIAFISLFFGLSPQLAEAHVWINGRSDPLAAFFALAALIFWRHGLSTTRPLRGWAAHAAATAFFLIALLSKEVVLLATPAILAWPEQAPVRLSARIRRTLGFAVASTIYLALRVNALHGIRMSTPSTKAASPLANLPVVLLDGLRELLIPTHLYLRSMRNEYATLSTTERWLILLAVLVIAVGAWVVRRKTPVFAWSLGWFALTLAPACLISVVLWPGFGRYLYIPCVGLSLGLCELAEFALRRVDAAYNPRKATRINGLLFLLFASYLTALGLKLAAVTLDYRDNESLYGAAIINAPDSAHGYGWLGMWFYRNGDAERALPLLEKAVALDPTQWRYLESLIMAYLSAHRAEAAEAAALEGLNRTRPERGGSLRAFLVQSIANKDPKRTVIQLCRCLHYEPDFPKCVEEVRVLLAPRGPRAAQYRALFENFAQTCPSPYATKTVARLLAETGTTR